MDNIRSAIELIFKRQNCSDIIRLFKKSYDKDIFALFNKEWLSRNFMHDQPGCYTYDELHKLYEILDRKWFLGIDQESKNVKSIFNPLLHFSNNVLSIEYEEPICKFNQLLRWRMLSHIVGEDMCTTSFLAYKDLEAGKDRNFFSWKTTISTDNKTLNNIFKGGLTDLHFHLAGSSLNFELNWLSLMNDVKDRASKFKELHYLKNPKVSFENESDSGERGLYYECMLAAELRLGLFNYLNRQESQSSRLFECESSVEYNLYIPALQRDIECAHYLFGRRYRNQVVDYAIPRNIPLGKIPQNGNISSTVMHGERWLMYCAFKRIYSGDKHFPSHHFYMYLLIKQRLRDELVQTNKEAGFINFQQYQDHKMHFIKTGSIYETLIYNVAINTTMANQNISYLEARIKPKNCSDKQANAIAWTDNTIADKRFKLNAPDKFFDSDSVKSYDYHYILHFIKSADESNTKTMLT